MLVWTNILADLYIAFQDSLISGSIIILEELNSFCPITNASPNLNCYKFAGLWSCKERLVLLHVIIDMLNWWIAGHLESHGSWVPPGYWSIIIDLTVSCMVNGKLLLHFSTMVNNIAIHGFYTKFPAWLMKYVIWDLLCKEDVQKNLCA